MIQGVALAGAVALNPFVGGIFALVWGVAVLIDAMRRPAPLPRILRHAVAAVPVALALAGASRRGWSRAPAASLEFGFDGASRHAPLSSLFLSLGPVLIPACGGSLLVRREDPRAGAVDCAVR